MVEDIRLRVAYDDDPVTVVDKVNSALAEAGLNLEFRWAKDELKPGYETYYLVEVRHGS